MIPKLDEIVSGVDLIYLACPYTHKHAKIRRSRYRQVNSMAAALSREGYIVFSPITQSVAMLKDGDVKLDTTWEFWKNVDYAFLARCSRLMVLPLPGWDESIGVCAEIEAAQEWDIPVWFVVPESWPMLTNEVKNLDFPVLYVKV